MPGLPAGTRRTAITFPPCPVAAPPAFTRPWPGRAAATATHRAAAASSRSPSEAAGLDGDRAVAAARGPDARRGGPGRGGPGGRVAAARVTSRVARDYLDHAGLCRARPAGDCQRDGDEHLRRADYRHDRAAPVVEHPLCQPGRASVLCRRPDRRGGLPGTRRGHVRSPRAGPARDGRLVDLRADASAWPDPVRRLPAGRGGRQRGRQGPGDQPYLPAVLAGQACARPGTPGHRVDLADDQRPAAVRLRRPADQ